jgi:hypothetical protein
MLIKTVNKIDVDRCIYMVSRLIKKDAVNNNKPMMLLEK